MRLKNYTDIPSDFIRAVIRATCPSNVKNFDVQVGNYGGRRGRGVAYYNGSSYHSRACPFIRVFVAKTDAWARSSGKLRTGAYLQYAVGSRREVLVSIMAHELRHLWQSKVKKGWRVWGARGQFSERDADAYALKMLRKYRRGELVKNTTQPNVWNEV